MFLMSACPHDKFNFEDYLPHLVIFGLHFYPGSSSKFFFQSFLIYPCIHLYIYINFYTCKYFCFSKLLLIWTHRKVRKANATLSFITKSFFIRNTFISVQGFFSVNKLVFVNVKTFPEHFYSSHCCLYPSTMAFSELLQHLGNFGRFQIILAIASLSLVTLITTHNFVEIFSAAVPAYCCYIHLLDNTTSQINLTRNKTAHALLRISIPMGAN